MSGGRGPERPRLLAPWSVLASTCAASMWLMPGQETMPYHLAWIGMALAYGFDPWPPLTTAVAMSAYTLVTGAVLVQRAASGVIAWEETGEIPLMCVLVGMMVWHVRRRMAALDALAAIAAAESLRVAQRERLSRLTTHEMRTTLTVATGYVDLMMSQERRPSMLQELAVVRDELRRLTRASERFLRLYRLQDRMPRTDVDLDEFVREALARWSPVADRVWVVDSCAGRFACSTERIRTCLDTLVENALRYTPVGGTIRLLCFRTEDAVYLGVADSGAGLQRDLATALNRAGCDPAPVADAMLDPLAQTGLGLALVQEVVAARRGRLLAGTSAEGGALLLMRLPAAPVAATQPELTYVGLGAAVVPA